MNKTLAIAGVMLAMSCPLASAEGINLAWDDCGVLGSSSMTFDCATNSGVPFSMIASFIPPAGVDQFLGIAAQVDVTSNSASLPDWWEHGTGQCRSTNGLAVSFDFTSLTVSCTDFYQGAAVGGFLYDVGYGSPNRARLVIQAAVPIDNRGPVDSGTEYAACRINVLRSKSTGAGFCAGCSSPMCIVLNTIQLYQPPDALFDPVLSNPANANFVTWQASSVPGCPLSTTTPSSTWGQVKSLYR